MPNANTYEARIPKRRNSAGEFVVKLYKNGQHVKDADYCTPDREDADSSALAMVAHANIHQT